jgi:hypothetical protein
MDFLFKLLRKDSDSSDLCVGDWLVDVGEKLVETRKFWSTRLFVYF